MKIDYSILWFEDLKEWYDSMVPSLSEYLEERGFNLISDRRENGENLERLFDGNNFDLVLVDYKLKDTELGDTIIDKIRTFSLYTNIVFYSTDGEKKLRELLHKRDVEGVYCAEREGEQFKEKVFSVIDLAIKKVQDINNMRGLVMATTSELDLSMYDIISKKSTVLGEKEKEVFNEKIKTRFVEAIEKRARSINTIDSKTDFNVLLQKLESYHRWIAVCGICKESTELKEYDTIVKDYHPEIIKVRNKMAHLREEVDEAGNKILKSSMSGEDDFVFNDPNCIEIRSNLKKYAETFNKIKELI